MCGCECCSRGRKYRVQSQLGRGLKVHSEDVAAASHHGPSALRGYGGERCTLIPSGLKAIRENEMSKDRTGGNVRVYLLPPQILNPA